jgi:hypothetical protein
VQAPDRLAEPALGGIADAPLTGALVSRSDDAYHCSPHYGLHGMVWSETERASWSLTQSLDLARLCEQVRHSGPNLYSCRRTGLAVAAVARSRRSDVIRVLFDPGDFTLLLPQGT